MIDAEDNSLKTLRATRATPATRIIVCHLTTGKLILLSTESLPSPAMSGARASRALEAFMNRDPRFALSQELQAKQTLIDQARALTADDPDFFVDIIEGETSLLELIGALDASIVDDEILVDGSKVVLEKLQGRKRAAENRIDLKRRLLAHALHQIGLKTLRTPTSTLSVTEASVKAIAIAPEDIPSRWWKAQPPKLDQDRLTKAIRAREKALKEAEAISDPEDRSRALAAIETLHPPIPGVTPSNGGITLTRRV
jgi:Siphovirus Gp157